MRSLAKTINRINYQFVAHHWAQNLDYETQVKEFAKASLNLALIREEINITGTINNERFINFIKEAKEAVNNTFSANSAQNLFFSSLIAMIEETYERTKKDAK